MIVLVATALGSGIVTAVTLAPMSKLAALIVTPLVASLATVLAGAALAYRRTAYDDSLLALDAQTDAMVATLKSVSGQAPSSAPARRTEAA
ncbi:hypothetical protein [Methylobacterium sp. NFXW15]|uniref:hypothetical protein n=1 Tax=Methylobacterium sp. NFXW15 TaxID=2819512 RepID=UPI003CE89A9B